MSYAGQMIKMLRESHNMSQEELGKRIGVGRAAVNKYEKGVVENIPVKTIEKLALIFDTTPVHIMGWDGGEHPVSFELRVLNGVQHFYGDRAVQLLESFIMLDTKGQKRAIQYLAELQAIYGKNT